jgi:DNA-binding beta-propeller fold protein YncE
MPQPSLLVPLLVALAALAGCQGPHDLPGHLYRVAGNGESGFNGDGLPAASTALYLPSAVRVSPGGQLHLMDFNNMRLRAVRQDGTVMTVAGQGEHRAAISGALAAESPLENPIDFDFAPDGTIVMVALHDPRVLSVTPGGLLSVLAGTGEPGDEGDMGPAHLARFFELQAIARGPDGSIFVADRAASRVRVLRPSGVIEAFAGSGVAGYHGDGGPAASAQLRFPEALAVDGAGNVYIADTGNHVVRRVLATTGTIETFAGDGRRGSAPDGAPATGASLSGPRGLAVSEASVFVSDTGNHRIVRIDAAGTLRILAGTGEPGLSGDGGPAASARLFRPAGLGVADNQLYVADQGNHVVRRILLE